MRSYGVHRIIRSREKKWIASVGGMLLLLRLLFFFYIKINNIPNYTVWRDRLEEEEEEEEGETSLLYSPRQIVARSFFCFSLFFIRYDVMMRPTLTRTSRTPGVDSLDLTGPDLNRPRRKQTRRHLTRGDSVKVKIYNRILINWTPKMYLNIYIYIISHATVPKEISSSGRNADERLATRFENNYLAYTVTYQWRLTFFIDQIDGRFFTGVYDGVRDRRNENRSRFKNRTRACSYSG